MCGIVGLFIKNPALESQLGVLVAPMLSEMTERGHDSAGIAVYRDRVQTLARACGKSHVHNLEPEDMVALTMEATVMAGVPLAGTEWISGKGGM